jgi:thioredoxin reductase
MWCNAPKELMEFSDYTFEEHFKSKANIPAFLPRKDFLDYLIARNSVDGALEGVQFHHDVESVSYSSSNFTVQVRDITTNAVTTHKFDKCVWSGGMNAEPEKPIEFLELLKEFQGKVMHSCEATDNFEDVVKGKHVFLIGDSSSAEDLALRAIKLGARKITISSRGGDGDAYQTGSWPGPATVTVVYGPPYKVSKGKDITCHAVYWSTKRQKYRKDEEEESVKVKDVEVVILCTGYDYDFDCVDMNLRFDPEQEWHITSKNWLMDNNALTISLGNITPSANLNPGATCYPDVYRCLLISNPNMMYLTETQGSEMPIIDLDVDAWLVLGYLTGQVEIPKEKDMVKANLKQLEAEMQCPWFRADIDDSYAEELDDLDDTHWAENPEDERCLNLDRQIAVFMVERLARDAAAAKYPVDFGKPGKLSPIGNRLVENLLATGRARTALQKNSPDASWKTFRDAVQGTYVSAYTGKPNASLPAPWMKLSLDVKNPRLSSLKIM